MAEFCFVQLWIHPRKVCCTQPVKVACDRRSLVVQWFRIWCFHCGASVQSLVGEQRS